MTTSTGRVVFLTVCCSHFLSLYRFDEVRWRELPRSNRDHIRRARSIQVPSLPLSWSPAFSSFLTASQESFALSSSRPDRSGIADLVKGLLRLDPLERFTLPSSPNFFSALLVLTSLRLTPREALSMRFFAS
jgi:hypothetical protein